MSGWELIAILAFILFVFAVPIVVLSLYAIGLFVLGGIFHYYAEVYDWCWEKVQNAAEYWEDR